MLSFFIHRPYFRYTDFPWACCLSPKTVKANVVFLKTPASRCFPSLVLCSEIERAVKPCSWSCHGNVNYLVHIWPLEQTVHLPETERSKVEPGRKRLHHPCDQINHLFSLWCNPNAALSVPRSAFYPPFGFCFLLGPWRTEIIAANKNLFPLPGPLPVFCYLVFIPASTHQSTPSLGRKCPLSILHTWSIILYEVIIH